MGGENLAFKIWAITGRKSWDLFTNSNKSIDKSIANLSTCPWIYSCHSDIIS